MSDIQSSQSGAGVKETPTEDTRRSSTRTSDAQFEARQIKDSRGRPTVEVEITLGRVQGTGDVPAGASKGEDEAHTVEVKQAIENLNKVIIPLVRESRADLRQHQQLIELERAIIDRAGANFEDLGANAVVPMSRALWQVASRLRKRQLAQYIREYEPEVAGHGRVNLLMNIFNGGLHALKKGEKLGTDRIAIQEIMVVPVGATNYRDALAMGDRIDATLQDMLQLRYEASAVTRADEAGFSVKGLGDSSLAISHVFEAVERAGYAPGEDVKIALDVAASSFFDKATGKYHFDNRDVTSEDMIAYLVGVAERYPGRILSIEDGLDENDWEGWTKLSTELRKHDVTTIGDDLFVTQMQRLRRGVHNKSADAILIKINQNGSMCGTLDVMKFAREHGMQCVISHRSGETLDTSIADMAFGTGAMGLKAGDPQPETDFPDPSTWVRRRKYTRMIELEESRW
ncbi:MAG: phosphopyruvate hydratase [Myxococcota bacterium]